MPIAFMELADKWNAYRATAPVVANIHKIKKCKDKGKVIIILPFDYVSDGSTAHFTCQANSSNDFSDFHITEEGAVLFETGAKKAGKKVVGKGGKKKYYSLQMSGNGATRTATFSPATKVFDHDKGKNIDVVSDNIISSAERDAHALMRSFLVFADP